MPRSQPGLQMSERAVPGEDLDEKSKGKTRKVENSNCFASNTPEGAQKQKQDPEEMEQDDHIGQNLE